MYRRIALCCVFVFVPLCVAWAEEAPKGGELCDGAACILMPFYRLGKAIMSPDAQPSAPATSQAGGSSPPPQTSNQQQFVTPAPEEKNTAVAPDESAAPINKDDEADNTLPAAKHQAVSTLRGSRKLQAARYVAKSPTRPPHVLSRSRETVTVLADEPEKSRILALASLVKTPRIDVISSLDGVDACTHRQADYVVDTLQDPARVGPAIPLFSESLVIVARDVSDIRKLRGQHVSFGSPGGPSEKTAQRLFRSLKIEVRNIPLDPDNALDALSSGDLDAVALLVPRGDDRLATHDPKLHLVKLDESAAPSEGLKLSSINPASYLGVSWPNAPLTVVTVDVVLSPNPKAKSEQSAMSVYAALDRNAASLSRNGFDLIGGDAIMTMRSVARDVPSLREQSHAGGC